MHKNPGSAIVAIITLFLLTHIYASWVPPIGIPMPEFGIKETHRMYEGQTFEYGSVKKPYRNAGNGPYSHYIDNSSAASSDSDNPFGTDSTPRKTIPYDLPPGSVVEIHGGPYDFTNGADGAAGKLAVYGKGTADKPIFVRGVSVASRPVFSRMMLVFGSYIIVENCEFKKATILISQRYISANIDHIAVRNTELHGDGAETGNNSAIAVGNWHETTNFTISHIVVYNNRVHHFGNVNSTTENDWCGVVSSGYETFHVWIMDNVMFNLGGDAARVGNNPGWTPPYDSRFVYVSRNTMYGNRENAVDIKLMKDIVVSENKMSDFSPSSSSGGDAISIHYYPENVWCNFNVISKSVTGIKSSGVVDLYLLGNVIHDVTKGISYWDKGEIHMVGNTIADVDSFCIHNYGGVSEKLRPIVGNILSNLKKPSPTSYHIRCDAQGGAEASPVRCNLFHQPNDGSIAIRWRGKKCTFAEKCQDCKIGDPLFINPALYDYRLKADSPAIDAGAPYAEYWKLYKERFNQNIAFDIDGTSRPQGASCDIGAFERRTNNTLLPPKGLRLQSVSPK